MVIVEIQSVAVPTFISLFPQQVHDVDCPELNVKVGVPLPVTVPPVCTHAVPTLKIFTGAATELVPVIIILSSHEPNPSSLMSYNLKLTGPCTGELNVMVVVIVFVVFEVQSVLNNIP